MRIFGIDFTSAPRRGKPITCAVCCLDGQQLVLEAMDCWFHHQQFDDFLRRCDNALVAVDFPLGQPRRLVEALGWPTIWEQYVELVGGLSRRQFVDILEGYCRRQPPGDKHHLRVTDRRARAKSPMMVHGVPVGRMFHAGAPSIARAGISVLPCRPSRSGCVLVEAYPALLARRLLPREQYKEDRRHDQSLAERRADLMRRCADGTAGLTLARTGELAERIIADATGDQLDAVLCAVQGALALRHGPQLGIPPEADPAEGWIVGTPTE